MERDDDPMDPRLATTQAAFVAFLGHLERAVVDDEEGPWGSTNVTLPAFLEAMAGWLGDAREGGIPDDVPWPFVAQLLLAGHTYE